MKNLNDFANSMSVKPVEAHGLYAKYANGDEICWGFECTCKHQGKCDTCPDLDEYNDYCTKVLIALREEVSDM